MILRVSQGPSGKSRPGRWRRLGATVVEFSLIAGLMFVLILVIIEFGRAFMVLELLTEAARRGCRAGITANTNTTTQQIHDTAVNFLTSVGINGDTVTVSVNDGNGGQEAANAASGAEITVNVSVPASAVSWVPNALWPTGTISAQYSLIKE